MSHWRQLPYHHHTGQENCTWNFIQLRKIPRGVDAFLGHDIVISFPEIEINVAVPIDIKGGRCEPQNMAS
ncbi:hypothetical protein Pelo_18549 [Pelomyxa schiedti]|nr:hypothetical protein Pelo_18549 [Pelomyxa schiedti]